MSQSTEVIRKGDLFQNRYGMRIAADCDGLLVRWGPEVMLIPEARMIGALNQIGNVRVKERHSSPPTPEPSSGT